jgi:hypothetical protein
MRPEQRWSDRAVGLPPIFRVSESRKGQPPLVGSPKSRPSLCSFRLSIAGKLRPCECPGLLNGLGAGRDLTNRATAGVIAPVEVDARPTIREADFVAAGLGNGFVLTDADGGECYRTG